MKKLMILLIALGFVFQSFGKTLEQTNRDSDLSGIKVYADIDAYGKRALRELVPQYGHSVVKSQEQADYVIAQISTNKTGLLMDRYSSDYLLIDSNGTLIKQISSGDSCWAPKEMRCGRSLLADEWLRIATKKMNLFLKIMH